MKKLTLVALLLGSLSGIAQGQETVSVLVSESPAADAAPDFINHLHHKEWVRLDENGSVCGRVAVLTPEGVVEARIGVNVVVSYEGKALHETLTDSEGGFELSGLRPGTYAFQSRGDYTFAAFALHVLPSTAQHLSSELEVYASVISSDRVKTLISDNIVPDLNAGDDVYYRMFKEDPLAERRAFNGSHQVVLKDGALIGRVSRPGWTFGEQDLRGTIAQIVKDGEVVARAAVSRDGFFKVEKFSPGVYDLIVTGDDGVAALAFQAIEPEGLAQNNTKSGTVRLVSTQSGMVADSLCCELIQPPEITTCCDPVVENPIADAGIPVDPGMPMVGGGFVGPGGFSGGGFGGAGGGFGGAGGGFGGGGIGGLGGLLGVAGLAIGVAALADDDRANVGTPIAP